MLTQYFSGDMIVSIFEQHNAEAFLEFLATETKILSLLWTNQKMKSWVIHAIGDAGGRASLSMLARSFAEVTKPIEGGGRYALPEESIVDFLSRATYPHLALEGFLNLFPEGLEFPLPEEGPGIFVDSEGCTREKAIYLMELDSIFALLKLSKMLPHPQEAKIFFKTAMQTSNAFDSGGTQALSYIAKHYKDCIVLGIDLAEIARYSQSGAGLNFLNQQLKHLRYESGFDSMRSCIVSSAYFEGDEIYGSPKNKKRKVQEEPQEGAGIGQAKVDVAIKQEAEIKVENKVEVKVERNDDFEPAWTWSLWEGSEEFRKASEGSEKPVNKTSRILV